MRLLGIVFLVGGFLIRLFTAMNTIGWILMGLGAVLAVISFIIKKKIR